MTTAAKLIEILTADARAAVLELADKIDLLEIAISNVEYRAARDYEFGRGYNAAKNGQSRRLQRESTDWYEGYDARSAIAKATVNKFAHVTEGTAVIVDFTRCNDVSVNAFGVVDASIEFQCVPTLGVPGLVYVSFTPKGKRKARSYAVHQDCVTLK